MIDTLYHLSPLVSFVTPRTLIRLSLFNIGYSGSNGCSVPGFLRTFNLLAVTFPTNGYFFVVVAAGVLGFLMLDFSTLYDKDFFHQMIKEVLGIDYLDIIDRPNSQRDAKEIVLYNRDEVVHA